MRQRKFKIGEVVQNIRTQALYVIIADDGCREPTTQIRLGDVTQEGYIKYKSTNSKKLKAFYASLV